jgi:hypothetical protein
MLYSSEHAGNVGVQCDVARLILYVKTGSRKQREDFRSYLAAHPFVGCTPVQAFAKDGLPCDIHAEAYQTVYDVVGPVDDVLSAVSHPWCIRWEYALDVQPPHQAAGSGTPKPPKPTKQAREPRWHGSETDHVAPGRTIYVQTDAVAYPGDFVAPGCLWFQI